jgi:hypothetical protein
MLQVGSLGNLAVLLPLILLVAVALVATGAARMAAWWAASVALCIGLTAVSKINLYGCPLTLELRSPSGHTSDASPCRIESLARRLRVAI